MGKDPASVDAFPQKTVIGMLIKLVPGKLGGHEILDAAFFHDLRKSCAVAEHIRQPEDLVLHAEFFFEKSLTKLELADQGFSGSQVTVCFHPHAAFRFPASLFDTLLDPLVHLGMTLFYEGIKLWLAGHEMIIRILFHEF